MITSYSKLRVLWIPQVGSSNSFYIPVSTPEEGYKILSTLAFYDCFLENNSIRGDYCNTGGLQYFDFEEDDWCSWYYDENGEYYESLDEYVESKHPELRIFNRELAHQVYFGKD